jgi:hypothetical protein
LGDEDCAIQWAACNFARHVSRLRWRFISLLKFGAL